VLMSASFEEEMECLECSYVMALLQYDVQCMVSFKLLAIFCYSG
jgi:hypothetical protein